MASKNLMWRQLIANSCFSSCIAATPVVRSMPLPSTAEIIPFFGLRSSGPALHLHVHQAITFSTSLANPQAGKANSSNLTAETKTRESPSGCISLAAQNGWSCVASSRVLNGCKLEELEDSGRIKLQFNGFDTLAIQKYIFCSEFTLPRKVQTLERFPNKVLPFLNYGGKRGFAKVAVPSHKQSGVKLKLYLGSSGMIGEPYKRPPSLPFFQRWLSLEGWKLRKEYIMGQLKTAYTLAKLRQKNRGYSQHKFYHDASELYKKVNVALAQGDRSSLRQLVTDNLFSAMKNELKHREASWSRVEWELIGSIKKIRTLQARLIGFEKTNPDNAFVQVTLNLLSNQKFLAYDAQGKLVAGEKDKELLVEDIWVFEKPLLLSDAKWRLCGRISV